MAIENRDCGLGNQRDIYSSNVGLGVSGAIVAGSTFLINPIIPYPAQLEALQVAALGVSGSPAWTASILRFTATGLTTMPLGLSSLLVQSFGVSGAQGYSLFAVGSSQVQMLQGDLISIETSGSNSGVDNAIVTLVVQKLQDRVSAFGLPT